MAGVDRDLGEFGHDAIDAKRLVAQLPGLDGLVAEARVDLRGLRLSPHIGQVLAGHIAMLAVRTGDLVPTRRGLVEHDDLRALFILAENLVICARAASQAQRVAAGGDFIDEHLVRNRLVLLDDEIHLRGHGGGHRRAQDVPLRKPRPFPVFVDGMLKRQLPLAVERFRHRAGLWLNNTQPVAGEVRAVSGVDAEHGHSTSLQGIRKAPISYRMNAMKVQLS